MHIISYDTDTYIYIRIHTLEVYTVIGNTVIGMLLLSYSVLLSVFIYCPDKDVKPIQIIKKIIERIMCHTS